MAEEDDYAIFEEEPAEAEVDAGDGQLPHFRILLQFLENPDEGLGGGGLRYNSERLSYLVEAALDERRDDFVLKILKQFGWSEDSQGEGNLEREWCEGRLRWWA